MVYRPNPFIREKVWCWFVDLEMKVWPVFVALFGVKGIIVGLTDDISLTTLEDLSTSLHSLFENDTTEFYRLCNISVEEHQINRNYSAIIQSISSSLSDKFAHVQDALRDSVELANNLYRKRNVSGYCSSDCINDSCFYYPSYVGHEPCFNFSCSSLITRNVSLYSSIYIPLDNSKNDTSVLCFVQWSCALDDHFQNRSMDLLHSFGVTYQYLGSKDGFLRFYPPTELSILNQCPRCPVPSTYTFDVKQRPWYTNTVIGTKFFIILIDLSGSMTGKRIALAQLTAKLILQSLTSSDYFLVIKVASNSETGPLDCFKNKTRASPQNLFIVTEVLLKEKSYTRGHANFSGAIIQAFEAMSGSNESYKIIIVLSDKDADHQQLNGAIESQYKPNEEVRIFIFLFGLGSNDQLKSIARANRGRMYEVQDYSDILISTTMFANDLRKIDASARYMDEVVWSHYRDVFGDLVLTGSLPLTSDINESGEFLGVMGIDFNVKNLQKVFLEHNLCGLSYGFMTDNHGQIIVHPQIDYSFIKNNLSLDDLINLDIIYLEHAQNSFELESLRNAMLDRKSGNITLVTWLPLEKNRRYLLTNVTYYYSPVENTTFSVAIALQNCCPQDMCMYNNTDDPEVLTVYDDPAGPSVLLENRIFAIGLSEDCALITDCSRRKTDYPCNYLNSIVQEHERNHGLLSIYADPSGVVAVKRLQSNQIPHMSTFPSAGVVGIVLDEVLLNTVVSDTIASSIGGSDSLLYLLDSNGFILWVSSDVEQSQMYSQLFAKYQPMVFADIVNSSAFIVGTFATYGPKPCEPCSTDHNVQFFQPASCTTCCNCPINLCLEYPTAIQLHPDFKSNISNQIDCPDNSGDSISYIASGIRNTNLVLVKVSGNCSTDIDNQSCLPCEAIVDSTKDSDLYSPQSVKQTIHFNKHKYLFCSGSAICQLNKLNTVSIFFPFFCFLLFFFM